MSARRFVALDRDGTVIVERTYLSDPNQVELLPNAVAGMKRFRAMGLGIIIVTNQSGIGRGMFDAVRLEQIHRRLIDLLAEQDVRLDGLYVCPHTPDDDCGCRKPRPGLLDLAAIGLGFKMEECFVIGDKACDIDLGRGVGATTFLVRTGYGTAVEASGVARPDHVVQDLEEAATTIARLLASGKSASDGGR